MTRGKTRSAWAKMPHSRFSRKSRHEFVVQRVERFELADALLLSGQCFADTRLP